MTRFLAVGALLAGAASAGAWPQEPGRGLAINSVGLASAEGQAQRLLFEGYGEAGIGAGLTAVFTFEGEMTRGTALYGWRAGAGLRWSFALEDAGPWVFGVEARANWQDHGSALNDPVFAGDGVGGVLQADAGRSFRVWGADGFANLSAGWAWRGETADEFRFSAVAGLDLAEDWQAGAAYFSTYAPGDLYDPGVYEKHEANVSLRWRVHPDYALSLSLSQTLASDRAPRETVLRLAVWTFFAPSNGD